jgi:predicted DNA-binding transcriptional regulator AlpA
MRENEFLSVQEVAVFLNVSVATVWSWCKSLDGFPQPIKFGPRTTRWSLQELLAFVESQKKR